MRPEEKAAAPESAASGESFGDSLRRLIEVSVDSAQARLELIKFEIGDERARLGLLLGRGVLAAFLIGLTVQLAALLAVVLAWDTSWRIPVVAGLATTSLVATILSIRWYLATPDSTLFEDSAREIAADVSAIGARQR